MLHCHSYWSDGRAFPEQAVSAYKELGYDFMSLTDHNRLSMTADRWCPVCEKEGGWRELMEHPGVSQAKLRGALAERFFVGHRS